MGRKTLTGMLAALVWATLAAAEAPEKPAASLQKLTPAERIAAVRVIAAAQPGKVLKDWMTPGAFARWQSVYGALIRTDDRSSMMSDFFGQAMLTQGSQNEQSGVWMLYNPLQDNVLLLQTDNTEQLPRIEDFAFLTGTEFRGETLKKDERPQAIAPVKGDLDAVLLKNVAATAAVFRKAFPDAGKTFSLSKYRQTANADPVSANIAFRMAMLKRFTAPEAKADAEKAGEIALLLWKGDAAALDAYFDSPADSESAARYAALPERVKKSMLPSVYYRRTKTGSLLGFSSGLKPNLLILVRLTPSGKPFFVFLPLNEEFAVAMQSVEN